MKKIFKLICMSLIFFMSFTFITGCGCDKPLNVKLSVNINDTKDGNVHILRTVTKKFREPGNTPCYEKVEDEYILIPNAGGISVCYDKDGNEFEKATYANTDKIVIDSKEISFEDGIYNDATTYELPKESKYSLIFEFNVINYSSNIVNVKKVILNDILNNQIKEESIEKIKFDVSTIQTTVIDGENYYAINPNKSLKFTMELKGLKNSDAAEGIKEFNLNLPLTIK